MPASRAMPVRRQGSTWAAWVRRSRRWLDSAAPALQYDGRWRTWAWLARAVEAFGVVLDGVGRADGTKVGVVMRNRPEIVRTVTATLATRSRLVTLSSAIPLAKLSAEVEAMRLPVVVAGEADWSHDELVEAVRRAGSLGVAALDGEVPFRVVVAPSGGGRSPHRRRVWRWRCSPAARRVNRSESTSRSAGWSTNWRARPATGGGVRWASRG